MHLVIAAVLQSGTISPVRNYGCPCMEGKEKEETLKTETTVECYCWMPGMVLYDLLLMLIHSYLLILETVSWRFAYCWPLIQCILRHLDLLWLRRSPLRTFGLLTWVFYETACCEKYRGVDSTFISSFSVNSEVRQSCVLAQHFFFTNMVSVVGVVRLSLWCN